ncbi:MAG: hypothetical protein KBH11_02200 [Bacteroidia bacterium]|nr:hypothetical protein [Bacteroidia bacterium]
MMKSILFTLFLFLTLTKISYSQQKSSFVYVEIPAISEHRRDAELKELFNSIEGISAISYCENLHLAIIRTESNPETLKASIAQRMHDLQFRYSIKSNVSFERVMQFCN